MRIETDLGSGWTTSPEQTAFDLARNRPVWEISEATRIEMLQQLTSQLNWSIIDQVAAETRSVETLKRLRLIVGEELS